MRGVFSGGFKKAVLQTSAAATLTASSVWPSSDHAQNRHLPALDQNFIVEPSTAQHFYSAKEERSASPTVEHLELSYNSCGHEVINSNESDYVRDYDEDEVRSDISQLTYPSFLESSMLPEISNAVGPRFISELQERPITNVELAGVFSTLSHRKETLRRVTPSSLWPLDDKTVNSLFRDVSHLLDDVHLTETARRAVEFERRKQSDDDSIEFIESPPFYYQNPSPSAEVVSTGWLALLDHYRCGLCQDVFAAPHILNCTHSFCYGCLEDLQSSVDESLTGCCPMCKVPITNKTFERFMDDVICTAVEKEPDSVFKQDWTERRRRYLFSIEKNAQKQELNDEGEESFDEWYRSNRHIAIIGIAVAVLFIIAKIRS